MSKKVMGYLVFFVQSDNASFMRAHHYLACTDDVVICIALELVDYEEKQEVALQQMSAGYVRVHAVMRHVHSRPWHCR